MEFRILGPLEAYEAGNEVPIGGAKQRALLAVLLVNANRVVSNDRVTDALWEDGPPETARKAVQVQVSKLRKLLGPDRLLTRPSGYLLQVEPDSLDLDRFEVLLHEAREVDPEAAADKLREALALFRGRPLADIAHAQFVQGEIARIEELRLVALEERIEVELRLGLHAELVGELEALVGDHPLRDRLCRQRMLALYRCGRQAEALEVYQAARSALVEELGIEPGRDLRLLHQAILRQDPELELEERAAPVAVPTVADAFVGREPELAELTTGLADAIAGHCRFFLLEGEPGIGKSRLADELMRRAIGQGFLAFAGRCREGGGAPAYWPWTQALRAYSQRVDRRALRGQLGEGAADVAHIVPQLRGLLSALPAAHDAESEPARGRLFGSTATFLRNAAGEQPLAFFLDDLHAADEPSLILLRHLATTLVESRILIVGTVQDPYPALRASPESTLADLGDDPVARRIHLVGLNGQELGSLAESIAGTKLATRLVAALHAETKGNPLFVSEVVRLLGAEGRLDRDGTIEPLPESVGEVINRRLQRLSGECRRVLSLASVLGRDFGLVALERVADYTGIDKLLGVLDEAIADGTIEEVPGAVGSLLFGHALTRDALYEGIPATHRARLHRRVTEVLEALYAGSPDSHLAELAHHSLKAVPAGAPDKAIDYARRAANQAAAVCAYEEAARLYGTALQLVGGVASADDRTRSELLLALDEVKARADLDRSTVPPG